MVGFDPATKSANCTMIKSPTEHANVPLDGKRRVVPVDLSVLVELDLTGNAMHVYIQDNHRWEM